MIRQNPFLTHDGMLTARLELKDAQEGFAGVSGILWIIDSDGTSRIARFLNERLDEPHRKGKLTKENLATLAEVLATQDFFGLPSELGHKPNINPHRITMRFGEKTATWVLEPGQAIEDATEGEDQTSPQARFLIIAQAIQKLIEAGGSPQ